MRHILCLDQGFPTCVQLNSWVPRCQFKGYAEEPKNKKHTSLNEKMKNLYTIDMLLSICSKLCSSIQSQLSH